MLIISSNFVSGSSYFCASWIRAFLCFIDYVCIYTCHWYYRPYTIHSYKDYIRNTCRSFLPSSSLPFHNCFTQCRWKFLLLCGQSAHRLFLFALAFLSRTTSLFTVSSFTLWHYFSPFSSAIKSSSNWSNSSTIACLAS